ncbi:MAG: glycerol-3-phosphate dehydrogenase subunit GlpB [Thermoleophilaceae bacterium]|nr:glycerol-3-phosphate dehydrogenase subunit GlpB [Thermoleophilaceae bacterium]
MSHHDVVVVGTGLAGLTAAVRLAEDGARVLVLAKGVGATHLSAGTIDVLGYAPERVDRPAEALGALVDARPGHPYALVGAGGVAAAVDWFKARIAAGPLAPYAYAGGVEENLLLPTAVGVARPSAVVPETMAGGDLRRDAAICIVGFRALKDFHPALAADMLTRAGVRARGVELDLVPEGRVDVNALGFARAFDAPAFRAEVKAQVVAQLGVEERAAFPAVLGIADPHGAWTELEHGLGRAVFEIPTLPPSVPGMRVHKSLHETLRRAGGRVILNAVVTGAEHRGGHVSALRIRVGLREERRGADWVVLATGGLASGGIELDSRWKARETALGLPVTGVPEPGAERFRPGYFEDHPMARAGVAVDHGLRPVDGGGERLYENVLVAGATLAGAEPWREKCGDGLSLSTGYRAAELVLAASTAAGAAAGVAGS